MTYTYTYTNTYTYTYTDTYTYTYTYTGVRGLNVTYKEAIYSTSYGDRGEE
jgi:hypothetical protein